VDARILSRPEAAPTRVATAWLLVAVWAGVVWWLGTDAVGAQATSRYLAPLIEFLWPSGSPAQRFALLMTIRKLAHPSVYAVLAVLAFRAALLSGVSGLARGAAVALGLAIGLAGLDELRQSRSHARTGAASDVALDAAGASAALAALGFARRRGSGSVVARRSDQP
jgi:VanZ family protein